MDMVKEETERLREKTDEEIIDLYASQLITNFPFTVVLRALKVVMEERDLKLENISYILSFKKGDMIIEKTITGI